MKEPKTKHGKVMTSLRNRIITGEIAKGERMPTFDLIQEEFGVSRSVAQLAVNQLKQDGFVEAQNRQGIFVSANPPHLHRYGVVFPVTVSHPEWSRFNEVLINELNKILNENGQNEVVIFTGVSEEPNGEHVRTEIFEQIRRYRLAGMIFTPGTFEFADSAKFKKFKLPKVFAFSWLSPEHHPVVNSHGSGMIDRALEWFVQHGRKRVAIVYLADYFSIKKEVFEAHGLEFYPQWMQPIGRSHLEAAGNVVNLLLDYSDDECPDGIFIADDNLVAYAINAVVQSGKRIGHDLDIVAHCNWPAPVPSSVPIQRIGFDIAQLAATCVDAVDRQIAGVSVPDEQMVPAVFEDELSVVTKKGYSNCII